MQSQKSFFEIYKNLDDPRDNRGKVYPLIDIILLALYGVLTGFSDFTNMSYYLKKGKASSLQNSSFRKVFPHMMYFQMFLG